MLTIDLNEEDLFGIPEIDKHHQKLVSIVNECGVSIMLSDDCAQRVLKSKLVELHEYAGYHFEYEEKYMKQLAFDGYKKHKEQHDIFTAKVKALLGDTQEGAELPSIKTIAFFIEWVNDHLKIEDRAYVELFKAHGVQ